MLLWISESCARIRIPDLSAPLILRILLVLIMLVVTSMVLLCVHKMLRRREDAGWIGAERFAGRPYRGRRVVSAVLRYVPGGVKSGRRYDTGDGKGDEKGDGQEIDVGDTCAVM
jgi:hypothetical protein